MFSHLWPSQPPWQVWSKAARRRRVERSSINRWSTIQTAAHSTAAALARDKAGRTCLMKLISYLLFLFSSNTCHVRYFCILKFHDPIGMGEGAYPGIILIKLLRHSFTFSFTSKLWLLWCVSNDWLFCPCSNFQTIGITSKLLRTFSLVFNCPCTRS